MGISLCFVMKWLHINERRYMVVGGLGKKEGETTRVSPSFLLLVLGFSCRAWWPLQESEMDALEFG